MILRQGQGKRLFYARSVLLRYMTGVKNGLLTQPVGQKNYLETAPREALIKEPPGNAELFRLARRDLFLKQERTLPPSTVSKKVKQRRQTE